MKNLRNFALLLLMGFFFASCHKDELSNPSGDGEAAHRLEPPTSDVFGSLGSSAIKEQTQEFSVKLDTLTGPWIKWTSKKGVEVNILKNELSLDGHPVTDGTVDFGYLEIFDAGNMLVTNKTTMGKDDNGHLVPIITGGAFHIGGSVNGESLDSIIHIRLAVPTDLTGGMQSDMKMWHGNTDDQGNLTWVKIDPGQQKAFIDTSDNSIYGAVFNSFGWTNIDKYAGYQGPKTHLEVKVPDGFTDTNSVVYLKYTGEPNALARLDKWEENKQLFSEHYGWIPVGKKVSLIFASASTSGQWLIAVKENITIQDNEIYEFKSSETQTVNSNEEVVQMINSLP